MADWVAGAVVVVNQAGKLQFRYTGQFSSTKKEPFNPYGITTDSQSRILTSDGNNYCIHILDIGGHFLQYIDNCDLYFPFGLSVDNDDNLFVGNYIKSIVRKMRYSKEISFVKKMRMLSELSLAKRSEQIAH